jgi:hypothetical protein
MVSDFKRSGSNANDDGGGGSRKRGMGLSLSDGCLLHLQKELNKDERMSDWNRRPLGNAQLHYAALDAHCLLGILDDILERIGEPLSERSGVGEMYRASYSLIHSTANVCLDDDTSVAVSCDPHPWRALWKSRYVAN